MLSAFIKRGIVLSMAALLFAGCSKEAVKPDAGMADKSVAVTSDAEQRAAADRAAAEKAAADRAAAERAAAEKAAADRAAAERAAAERAAAAEQAEDKSIALLKTVNFDYDSYVLSEKARDILYSNAEILLKKYKGKVRLEGHCDERGSDEYNLALGENRAKSALNYLVTLGVPAEQLSTVSFGKEKPLDDGHTEEAWAKNRRVEFKAAK